MTIRRPHDKCLFRPARFLLIGALLCLAAGCTLLGPREPAAPAYFLMVTAKAGDHYETLSRTYLHDARKSWLIEEANGHAPLEPGMQVIIPLEPWRFGGVTALGYQRVPVLCYHHFSHHKRKRLTTLAKDFERQLRYLQDHGYRLIGVDELSAFLDGGALPEKAVMVTIDDGWRDAYTIAYPLLKQYAAPATLFLPTRFIYAPSRRTLTWEMIREMVADADVDIQAHTKTHRDLTVWPENMPLARYLREISRELEEGRLAIHKEIGRESRALAYPFGKRNDLIITMMKRHGYRMGFTVDRGGNAFFDDPFLLKRSMIFGTFDLQRFAAELTVFEPFPLEPPEPVDTLSSLHEILVDDPERFEKQGQLRTALMAWKLYRDQWLKDPRKVARAETNIDRLRALLKKKADAYYAKAAAATNEDDETRRRYALLALLYHPRHADARKLLREENRHAIRYHTQEGDTVARIARKFYRRSGYGVLVTTLNPHIHAAEPIPPGTELVLPRRAPVKKPRRSQAGHCGFETQTDRLKTARLLYEKAFEDFNQDRIAAAIDKLKRAVCLNPDDQPARQLLDMLQKL